MRNNTRKHLLLYLPSLACGGAERMAIVLAEAIRDLNHDVQLVAPSTQGEFSNDLPTDIPVSNLGCRKPIQGLKQLADLVSLIKPDAVLCFGMNTGIAAALSRYIYRWPAALLVRNENNLAEDWRHATWINRYVGPILSRWVARRAKIIAVSEGLALATASYLRVPRSKVFTILNPISAPGGTQYSACNSLHPWLRAPEIPSIVAMGRLEHQKGFDILINAFARISERTTSRLLIFGNGSLRPELQRQIDRAGLSDRIQLAGYTSDPAAQMRAAAAFILSSRYEGFGLVLAEALAAGTPVVATNCDYGPAEILEDGRFGTLVPVGDAEALARAMLNALGSREPISRPDAPWFSRFAPRVAAERHLALLD
jgi:glycosyltransferase involved in cell wall biosynthesis